MNEALLWYGLQELFLLDLMGDRGMGFEWLSHGSQPKMAALLRPGRPVWDFRFGHYRDNGFVQQWFLPVYNNVGERDGIHEAITTRLKPGDIQGVRSIVGARHEAVGRREIDSPIHEDADEVRRRILALLDEVEEERIRRADGRNGPEVSGRVLARQRVADEPGRIGAGPGRAARKGARRYG